MRLNPPKKTTFWTAVVFAVVSGILYAAQCANLIAFAWVYPLAYLLLVIAFVLLALGLILKGF